MLANILDENDELLSALDENLKEKLYSYLNDRRFSKLMVNLYFSSI